MHPVEAAHVLQFLTLLFNQAVHGVFSSSQSELSIGYFASPIIAVPDI
jgi:hypothetical protein